ncbi:MAG: NAD(P)-binding domain-containing protein, partial [Mycolicibacterium sp.]|nr:NAD(P)-binding domain-containing protein [Mycolicibacterium sp.]
MVEAAVMGAGAWGTALAKVLVEAGNFVTMWAREPEVADEINTAHRNTVYLPVASLPADIRASADPAEALSGITTVFLAIPAQVMREAITPWTGL